MPKRTTPWTDKTMNPTDVQERLDEFVSRVQFMVNLYWERMKFTHKEPCTIYAEYGKKYARIVSDGREPDGGGQRFVHSFVNMINGDILKAGGWKAPAPNAVRGNIFEDDFGAHCVNEHGTVYLKR